MIWIVIGTGTASAFLTFVMSHNLRLGPIRSSALLSLLVGLCIHFWGMLIADELAFAVPLITIGASFVGMTGKEVIKNPLWIGCAGGIFSGLWLCSNFFLENGLGGGLGSAACLSVLTVVGLRQIGAKLERKKS